MAGVPTSSSNWAGKSFKDDGALHVYTMIRTPTSIQILMDVTTV